ncbi:MAG: AI-2E family transporter [Planctomycetota bacterium]
MRKRFLRQGWSMDEQSEKNVPRRMVVALLAVIVSVLVIWALKVTYLVTMPLVFSFFLAILVRPLQHWLNHRFPRWLHWLSLVLAMASIVAVVGAGFGLLWFSARLAGGEKAAEYVEHVDHYWFLTVEWARQHDIPMEKNPFQTEGVAQPLVAWFTGLLTSAWSAAAMGILIFFFTLLMLVEAREWHEKSHQTFDRAGRSATAETMAEVALRVRQYLLLRTLVGLLAGVSGGLLLLLLGVELLLLWGVLIFLLSYVPNVGTLLALIPPAVITLVHPEIPLWRGVLTVGALAVMEGAIINFVDPRLEGRTLRVSPTLVLASILFWSWVWGVAGALLAVPLIVTFIVICQHVDPLKPLGRLLSRGPGYGAR